jgi:hypothetical protein
MSRYVRIATLAMSIMGSGIAGTASTAFAAAGSDPLGPINPVKTGADLKHACGQGVEGYHKVVGQKMWRAMMIVQCRAVVGAVVELAASGQLVGEDGPAWRCVQSPDDHDALTAAFVQWVGRRAPLLREPAAVAFVEAIEMSEKCSS